MKPVKVPSELYHDQSTCVGMESIRKDADHALSLS
jgi:hypothetical protein